MRRSPYEADLIVARASSLFLMLGCIALALAENLQVYTAGMLDTFKPLVVVQPQTDTPKKGSSYTPPDFLFA
jgi:hypothetical protein